jgi:superfamily II DNA or RNA helicase
MRLLFSSGTLLLEDAPREEVLRLFPSGPFRFDPRVGAFRCFALHHAAVRERLLAAGLPLEDRVEGWEPVAWSRADLHPLRPEQEAARAAFLAARRGLVVMPTGTGKTEVALAVMRDLALPVLVVSPVRDLMYQWHRRILAAFGHEAGVVGDSRYDRKPVSVTTYDSASIHMERLGADFALVVFDEVHHLAGEMRRDAALMCAAPWRLGLTATPERSDGRQGGLAELVGPVVHETPLSAARGRTLAEYDVVRIPVHLTDAEQARYDSLSAVVRAHMAARRREQPDYSWQDLCAEGGEDPESRRVQRAFHEKQAIEDRAEEKLRVLEDLFRLHPGERVLVFTGTNAMAREVSTRFLAPSLLAHSRRGERLEVLEGFAKGEYPVLVANRVLDEGVDLPEAKVAVVLGGMGSTRQAKQRLGRVLRRSGGRRAVLYEVVCTETREEERSRRRRDSDAYERTVHRRL